MSYTPDPGSLAALVCAYLRDHPTVTELTIARMCSLWPSKAKTSNVNPCLATPLQHNLLTRARNSAGDLVYRRGRCFDGPVKPVPQPPQPTPFASAPPAAGLADLESKRTDLLAHIEQTRAARQVNEEPAASPAPTTAAAPVPAPAPKRTGPAPKLPIQRLPELNVAELVTQIRSDLPVPTKFAARGQSRYDEIFDALRVPGQSLLLPREYLGAIKQAATKYSKRTGRKVNAFAIPDQPSKCGVWRLAPDAKTTSPNRSAA